MRKIREKRRRNLVAGVNSAEFATENEIQNFANWITKW